MMRWIVGSSLKFRRLIVALAVGLVVFGIVQVRNTKTDTLPEFTPTQVEIQTESLGLSATEVEQLITVPLEQDLLNGVAFLEDIESSSLPGLSSIVMTFEPGTDLLDARQVVQERLTQAHALPNVSQPPQMLAPTSSTSRVAMIQLTSDDKDLIEMSVDARWVIRPRLMGIDGVANVSIWGQRDRQLQVQVDPERLHAEGVSLLQIIQTTANSLWFCPLTFEECSTPGVPGQIDTANQRFGITTVNPIKTAAALGRVPIGDAVGQPAPGGAGPLVTLADVTEVVENHPPLIGDAVCEGQDCLVLVVEKFPGANTGDVTRSVEEALEALRPGFRTVEMDSSIFRPAAFIDESFGNLGMALIIGGVLLLLVLAAFSWSWRSTLIMALAITTSLAAAALVLSLRGTAIDLMVMAGLVMALGAVVDDAVIDVGRLRRRMQEHREQEGGAPLWGAVLAASSEMRGAMIFATLIVMAALAPAFFMEAEAGAFLPPIALTYLMAVGASMIVALTVTPALSLMLSSGDSSDRTKAPAARWLEQRFDRVSSKTVGRPSGAYAIVGVLAIVAVVVFPFLDRSMRPSLRERDLLIHASAEPGTSLPLMRELTTQVVEDLSGLPGVTTVGAQIGRAVMSDQVTDVSSAQIWVNVDPSADYDATVGSVEDAIDQHPELDNDLTTYSEDRVTDTLLRTEDDVVVRIYGENTETLAESASTVRGALIDIEGVEGAEVEVDAEQQVLEVQVDLDRARDYGLKPGDVRRAATTLVSGLTVGSLFEEQKVFDVVVWGVPEIREDEADLSALLIDTPSGGQVALSEVADVQAVSAPSVIRHESVSKYVDVSADLGGRGVGAVVADIHRALEGVDFPSEYHAEVLGGFAEEQAARSRVLAVAVAAALAIFLLLQAAFGSWRLAVLAFVMLPVGLSGGVLAALATDGTVTLGVAAGLIAVLGLMTRSVVVLIRHYQQLQRRDGRAFDDELVIEGTRDRLMPTLMSTIGAVVMLLPFAVMRGAGGFEMVGPMAIVIIGGLVTSALVTLVVVPALYRRFGLIAESESSDLDVVVLVPDVDPVAG